MRCIGGHEIFPGKINEPPSRCETRGLPCKRDSKQREGGKSASLSVQNKPTKMIIRRGTTPCEVKTYMDQGGDKKSLDVRANDETIAFCQRLDTELFKRAKN